MSNLSSRRQTLYIRCCWLMAFWVGGKGGGVYGSPGGIVNWIISIFLHARKPLLEINTLPVPPEGMVLPQLSHRNNTTTPSYIRPPGPPLPNPYIHYTWLKYCRPTCLLLFTSQYSEIRSETKDSGAAPLLSCWRAGGWQLNTEDAIAPGDNW